MHLRNPCFLWHQVWFTLSSSDSQDLPFSSDILVRGVVKKTVIRHLVAATILNIHTTALRRVKQARARAHFQRRAIQIGLFYNVKILSSIDLGKLVHFQGLAQTHNIY